MISNLITFCIFVFVGLFIISCALFGYHIKIEKGVLMFEWGLSYYLERIAKSGSPKDNPPEPPNPGKEADGS